MSFRAHARAQAASCTALGAPFMARLMLLIADSLCPGTPVADRLLGWPTERIEEDAPALRLAAGLHHLVLTGQARILARLYAAPDSVTDEALWRAIDAALKQHAAALLETLALPPQTNEVARAAIYRAAAQWLTAAYRLPLVVTELGSAAGLNLLWDHYALDVAGQRFGPADATLCLAPDWTGPPPPDTRPVIRARAGVDLNPLDPETDRLRALSYIWPDQPERRARLDDALTLAAAHRPDVTRGDAASWLETRLARPLPQAIHLVCHSIFWQYLPEEDQARINTMLSRVGGRLRGDEPLAHLSYEPDGNGPGAAVTLHLWPGNDRISLGRADYHGRWVIWAPPALE